MAGTAIAPPQATPGATPPVDVQAILARLRAGTMTEEDMDTAQTVVKGLKDGTLDKDALLLKAVDDEDTDEAGDGKGDGDADEDEETKRKVKKAVDEALLAAGVTPKPEETPAPQPSVPADPEALAKSLAAHPEAQRAINAVPALQAIAESFKDLVATVNGIQTEQLSIRKSLDLVIENQKAAPAAPVATAPNAVTETNETRILKGIGNDTAAALTAALESAGLGEIRQQIEQLDQAVNHRPYSQHPPRGGDPIRKGLGQNGEKPLTKTDCIGIIQKSLDAALEKGGDDSARIRNQDTAANALAELDIIDKAISMGRPVSHADVVQRYYPKELEQYVPER